MATQNSINNGTNSDNTTLLGLNAKTNLGSQPNNTGVGYNVFNASGSLSYSVALGVNALSSCTNGTSNVAIGAGSMASANNTSGGVNTAVGADSMGGSLDPIGCTALGQSALFSIQSGNSNVAVGDSALTNLDSGHRCIAIGQSAGVHYNGSESDNIILGYNFGVMGESRTLRIGNIDSGFPLTTAFIEGIAGVSVSNTEMVTIDSSTGQLGSQSLPSGALSWTVITADQSATSGNGYFCNKAGTVCAVQLPATSLVGDTFSIVAMNAQGWNITQASGQQIFLGANASTLGATGTFSSTVLGDTATLVCRVANTEWQVVSFVGAPSLA